VTASETAVSARRFYAGALNDAEQSDFPSALEIVGVDEELALLRLRLRTALADHPEDLPLMFKGIDLLVKLVAARYRLSKGDLRDFAEAAAGLRTEIQQGLAKDESDG